MPASNYITKIILGIYTVTERNRIQKGAEQAAGVWLVKTIYSMWSTTGISYRNSVNITGRLRQINDTTGISQSYDKGCKTNRSSSVPQHRTSYTHLRGKGEVFPSMP
jgi:hypothetical protein